MGGELVIDGLLAWLAVSELPIYRIGHTTGAVVAVVTTVWLARRQGLPLGRVLALTGAVVVGVWAGARGLHLALNLDLYRVQPERLLRPRFGGFALYGGLLLGAVVGWFVARRLRLPVWRLADAALIGGGLGLACLRCGCFGHGCCFGVPTDLPWGVTYPPGSPAWLADLGGPIPGLGSADAVAAPVHPTQLYELLAALTTVALVLVLRRRGLPPGVPALLAAAGFTVFRAVNWELRATPSAFQAPGWFYPSFYALLAAALVTAAVWRWRHPGALGQDDVLADRSLPESDAARSA